MCGFEGDVYETVTPPSEKHVCGCSVSWKDVEECESKLSVWLCVATTSARGKDGDLGVGGDTEAGGVPGEGYK